MPRIRPGSRLVIAALLLLEIFCWIEVDLYAPSFPQLRQAFGTTQEMIQWTLSLNCLGYFLASLVVGPLADAFGRRPVILAGSAVFVAGSLCCVAAASLPVLFLGRVLQGLGVAAPTTLVAAVVGDVHQGDGQVRILSTMNSVVTITMAAAPMVGAWLSSAYGWRANFGLIFAGSALATVLVAFLVPETLAPGSRQAFSLRKVAANYGRLLRCRSFLATTFGLTLVAVPYWIFIATAPFLFQETLGVPMGRYVLLQGAVVGLFSVLSLGVPFLVGRVDPSRLLRGSLLLALAAAVLLCLHGLALPDSAPAITALMCLFIVGIVWPCACFYTMVFALFPDLKGSVASLCSAIRMMVMAGAIALNGHFYEDSFRSVGILVLALVALGFPILSWSAGSRTFTLGRDAAGGH